MDKLAQNMDKLAQNMDKLARKVDKLIDNKAVGEEAEFQVCQPILYQR